MEDTICYANDRFQKFNEAGVSLEDLGVLRGYAIFDFFRISNNKPLFLADHLDRFFHSAAVMRLGIKETKEQLGNIVRELIARNDMPDSGMKILLSGGRSPDGYQIGEPAMVMIQQKIIPPPIDINIVGLKLVSYSYQRQLSQVKTIDYLMAIWLQPWVKENGADDILYYHNGIISECPRSNIFLVTKNNELLTPSNNMLKGVTRKHVLKLAHEMGINFSEKDISMDELCDAKEVFITSSTKRIIPIRQVDDIVFDSYHTDSMTCKLYDHFFENEMRIINA